MTRAAVIALVLAWTAPPAHAATVRVDVRPGPCGESCSKYGGMPPVIHSLRVEAAPGEINTTVVTWREDGWTVTDGTAPLVAGDRCTAVDEHTVTCPPATDVRVEAGDGDDRLAASTVQIVQLDGGPGDDAITGGAGGDVISGGSGADTLLGGAGDDVLDDGDAPGADRFDGGPGLDRVRYAHRREPVRADLRRRGGQGARGEDDSFASIEGVVGGRGDDRLIGSRHGDRLAGGNGRDVLLGGGGADRLDGGDGRDRIGGGRGGDELHGGAGRDRLSAGAGDDMVGSRDGIAEHVHCGGGRDKLGEYLLVDDTYTDVLAEDIFGPDAVDVIAGDCERAHLDESFDQRIVPVRPVARTAASLLFPNPCGAYCERGTLRIRLAGRSLALVRFGHRGRQPVIALPLAAVPARRVLLVSWRVDDGGVFDGIAFRTTLR